MKKRFFGCVVVFLLFCFILREGVGDQDLRNKIGEMLIVGFQDYQFNEESLIAEDIEKYHVGGVILFAKTESGEIRNIVNPEQLQAMIEQLQTHAKKTRKENEGGLFIGIDQEGGKVSRLSKENGFVFEDISAKELGRKNDINFTFEYAVRLGSYLKELGINLNFAPVVDLGVDENNFIYKKERCFSGEGKSVYEQAEAFIKGIHISSIKTVLKHFPGHGSSLGDTHRGLVDVTGTWSSKELEPYQKFVDGGYEDMIMMSHVINRVLDGASVPATFSKKMVDLLREEMGFEGIIISDDLCMGAIVNEYSFEDTLKYAINSGVDMLILANHQSDQTKDAVDIIEKFVAEGEVSAQRIEEAYNRIIKLKSTTFNEKKEL